MDMRTHFARRALNRASTLAFCLPGLLAFAVSARAADLPKQQVDFFESKIRPILADNCYQCHSMEQGKSKGGLTLDTRDGWMHGGEDGQVIDPGNPVKSMLIVAIGYSDKDLQMPPKDKKLSDDDIAALTEWVKMGAPDPRTSAGASKLTGLHRQGASPLGFPARAKARGPRGEKCRMVRDSQWTSSSSRSWRSTT